MLVARADVNADLVYELTRSMYENEEFLILTDPIAQKWMDAKSGDLERWLHGMRRLGQQLGGSYPIQNE